MKRALVGGPATPRRERRRRLEWPRRGRTALIVTLLAAGVTFAAAALARRSSAPRAPGLGLGARGAAALLLALFVFLAFEWFAHFLGARVGSDRHALRARVQPFAGAADAAWAALSSAGIWIALLVVAPGVIGLLRLSPAGVPAIAVMSIAASAGLLGRLWLLREIYEMRMERAAALWAASRAAAVVVFGVAVALYAAASALSPAGLDAVAHAVP